MIIGGGPAGLAAGLSCKASGCSVTLLERGLRRRRPPGEYLSAHGRRLLAALEVPAEIFSDIVRETFSVDSRWGTAQLSSQDSIFTPDGQAWLIVRPAFDEAFAAYALRQGVDIQTGMTVRDLKREGGRWYVTATSGRRAIDFRADVVIDASGRRSYLARRLGAHPAHYDRLVGVTAFCQAGDCKRALLVESGPDGWWYSAVLPNNHLFLTYMTDVDMVRDEGGPRLTWMRALQMAEGTSERWTGPIPPTEVYVRPAMTTILNRVTGPGWFVIGDAAFSRDPLSSEGINAALEDGLTLGGLNVASVKGYAPSLDHNRRVIEYLGRRAVVYGWERRWPGSTFWHRRHCPVWATTTMHISPDSATLGLDNSRLQELRHYCPGIDRAALQAALTKGTTAREVAQAYRNMPVPQFSDHELLASLQFLGEAPQNGAKVR